MRYFILAELGVNHLGSMDTAKEMIDQAEEAGADAVKLQYYVWEDLQEDFGQDFQPNTLIEQVKKSQLSLSQLQDLRDYARSIGIGWVCTPFKRPRRVAELASLKPDAIKIRYKDFYQEPRMLDAALKTDVQLILVSCAAPPIDNMSIFYNPRIRWLACIPKYPPAPGDFNLSRDSAFHGFSDHFPHITASLLAAAVTSQSEFIIEKHLVLDGQTEAPDLAVSITFNELKDLVTHLRRIEKLRPANQTQWLPKHGR